MEARVDRKPAEAAPPWQFADTFRKARLSGAAQRNPETRAGTKENWRGEWVSVGNIEEQRAYFKKLAENTLAKQRKRISISVPELDLIRLKKRAAEEGMPYQTLINSILHKYVTNR